MLLFLVAVRDKLTCEKFQWHGRLRSLLIVTAQCLVGQKAGAEPWEAK